ncbi:MAG: hypothetical protein J6C66_06860 [Prevotella sp.]|nr:hypothetical protein [Prevotella sp.]MBQ8627928.1 hypothetical protein [Prevotella sp.]
MKQGGMNAVGIRLSTLQKIRKKRLKKSAYACCQASFCFVNTKKYDDGGSLKTAKGHQTHRQIFYFESCVCQKKRIKSAHLFRHIACDRK